ncbi:hypothetical protein [Yoonia sp. BS5-3]|uniref:Uncharacterized protein n=1 Tax=Yoonia phaeophyticola TaxID=3137369 RepID=A0ABZ2V5W9_9RHOB
MNEILIPTGPAELVDQITMAQHKAQAATDPVCHRVLMQRLNLMQRVAARVLPQDQPFGQLRAAIVSARHDLIQLESDLRICEARADFDIAFVALARAYLEAMDTLEHHKRALDDHAGPGLEPDISPAADH